MLACSLSEALPEYSPAFQGDLLNLVYCLNPIPLGINQALNIKDLTSREHSDRISTLLRQLYVGLGLLFAIRRFCQQETVMGNSVFTHLITIMTSQRKGTGGPVSFRLASVGNSKH